MYKILLIDDDKSFLEAFYQMLDWSKYGFEVAARLNDGEDALEFIEKNQVDAVITDISMPKVSGIDLAKNIYEKYPKIKVVFFSAFRNYEYATLAVDYDVVGYINKPILFSRIEEVLAKLRAKLDKERDAAEVKTVQQKSDDKLFDEVEQYVNEHYAEQIDIKTIANLFHFNHQYFSNLYKSVRGEKFVDYVNRIRVEKAKELLKDSDMDIDALYNAVGFTSRRNFFRVFAAYTDDTPIQYRKKMSEVRK